MAEIKTILIFEMLGRPIEHLKSTFEQFVDKIAKEEGFNVCNKKIHEPKRIENSKQELFTTFAELEINFKDFLNFSKAILFYMPSHVEIISPEEIQIKNFDLNSVSNELISRLHQYDEIAKRLIMENNILQAQIQKPQNLAEKPAVKKANKKRKKS